MVVTVLDLSQPKPEPAKSKVLEPVEDFLGFGIADCADDEFDTCDQHEMECLASDIDKVLSTDWERIVAVPNQVVPISGGTWTIENALQEKLNHLPLLYNQILLPTDTIIDAGMLDDEKAVGWRTLKRDVQKFVIWLRGHAPLIRSGAIFPFNPHIYMTHSLQQLSESVASAIDVKALRVEPHQIGPCVKGIVGEEKVNIIQGMVETLHAQLFCVRRWGAAPAMTDRGSWRMWRALVNNALLPKLTKKSECQVASTLVKIKLPKLNAMPTAEIIALHQQSEAFALWRDRLSIVLRSVQGRYAKGETGEQVLRDELWPLTDAVDKLKKELKGSSLADLTSRQQTAVAVGIATLGVTYPIMSYLGIDPGMEKDLLKLGSGALVILLWSVLFGRPSQDATSIVNMYNATF